MTTLLERARALAGAARASGALEPLGSELVRVDGFEVRLLRGFERKPSGHRAARAEPAPDPFLPPYPPALHVEDRPPDHALLLNRYPVLDDHLLLVTLAPLDQEQPASASDLRALDRLLDEIDGLGFYNGGRDAGASQPHRHLQLVARNTLGEVPLEPAIEAALRGDNPVRVDGWRFTHAAGPPDIDPGALLRAVGRDPAAPGPHSLLATRRWRLVVPRSTGVVDEMPVNSLAYAGLLAVKSEEQLARLREIGPWAVLERAGAPPG